MDKKKFEIALKKAYKYENKLKSACVDLEILFEPFFNGNIAVFYQPSDGLVILHDIDSPIATGANKNTGVKEAIKNISKDPNFYINGNAF